MCSCAHMVFSCLHGCMIVLHAPQERLRSNGLEGTSSPDPALRCHRAPPLACRAEPAVPAALLCCRRMC